MISEELKVIVDKFHEQGKMNFFSETTEEKIAEFEKEKSIKFPESIRNGCCFQMVESCSCLQEFNYMA